MRRRRFLALASGAIAGAGCVSDLPARSPTGTAGPSSSARVERGEGDSGATVAWARRYTADGGRETSTPGLPEMYLVAVAPGADGGFTLSGYRADQDGRDMVLFETDSDGRSQWYETYGGERRDQASGFVRTDDGGALLFGVNGRVADVETEPPTETPVPTRKRAWAVKAAADGTRQWAVQPTDDVRAGLADAVQLADGSYALVGSTAHDTGRAEWYVHVDADGQVVTRQTYNNEGGGPTPTRPVESKDVDRFTAVCRGTDGGLVFAGENNSGGWLVHTDEDGTIQWQLDLEYPRGVVGDVIRVAEGGYAATGQRYAHEHPVTLNENPSDLYLMQIDGAGRVRWTRAYDGGRSEVGERVIGTTDGGYLAVGGTPSSGKKGVFLAKTAADGTHEWSERFQFSSTGGNPEREPWPVPTHGHDAAEVAEGEYAVAAGRVFMKIVYTEPTPTAAETMQPNDSPTATGTATESPDTSETETSTPTETVDNSTADGS